MLCGLLSLEIGDYLSKDSLLAPHLLAHLFSILSVMACFNAGLLYAKQTKPPVEIVDFTIDNAPNHQFITPVKVKDFREPSNSFTKDSKGR